MIGVPRSTQNETPEERDETYEELSSIVKCHLHLKFDKRCKRCSLYKAYTKGGVLSTSKAIDSSNKGTPEYRNDGVLLLTNTNNYNYTPIMQQKLYASSYFHSLLHFDSVDPILDELLNVCKDVKPHVPGTDVPSTLFCCLYRLFQLRLRKHQLDSILNFIGTSKDNNKDAFVRVVGILYVRFGLHPDQYLSHYKPYLLDIQRIPQCKPTSSASMTVREGRDSHPPASTASALFRAEASGTVNREAAKMEPLSSLASCYIDNTCLTIGEFIEHLLVDERYHGIVLPRIPISTKKEIASTIDTICKPEFRRLAASNTEKIEYFTEGTKVDACSNHDWLHGEILEVNSSIPHRVTVTVQLEDDTTEELSIGMLKLMNLQRDKESKRSRDTSPSMGHGSHPSPYEENARTLYSGSRPLGRGRSPPDGKCKKKRYYHM